MRERFDLIGEAPSEECSLRGAGHEEPALPLAILATEGGVSLDACGLSESRVSEPVALEGVVDDTLARSAQDRAGECGFLSGLIAVYSEPDSVILVEPVVGTPSFLETLFARIASPGEFLQTAGRVAELMIHEPVQAARREASVHQDEVETEPVVGDSVLSTRIDWVVPGLHAGLEIPTFQQFGLVNVAQCTPGRLHVRTARNAMSGYLGAAA